MEYITGWTTVLGLIVTSALLVMNVLSPLQSERRIWVHCAMGKLTLVATIAHLLSVSFDDFNDIAIWASVVLIFVTVGTGLILSYLPDAGKIRYLIRSIHPALILAIIITVIHHVLVTLGIL
jgi:hypothetical protein